MVCDTLMKTPLANIGYLTVLAITPPRTGPKSASLDPLFFFYFLMNCADTNLFVLSLSCERISRVSWCSSEKQCTTSVLLHAGVGGYHSRQNVFVLGAETCCILKQHNERDFRSELSLW